MTYMPEDEEVKTYSELVAFLEEQLISFMEKGVARFSGLLSLFNPPPAIRITPSNRDWRVAAVDGGSSILSFADVNIAFAAAIAIIDDGIAFKRKVMKPQLLIQDFGESDGEFADRVDIERETMMLELAQRVLVEESPELLIVDGPLIPRPKYMGEYMLQLRNLLHHCPADTRLIGFVKRPQSRYLTDLKITDRALLSACLERFQVAPWPPHTTLFNEVNELGIRYTYIRLLEEAEAGVFRIDFHPRISTDAIYDVISYIAYTSDFKRGPPAILMKADEEVKMSRRLISELYRSCFAYVSSRTPPKLWAPLVLRWGERAW